jgi:hypothetical protein
MKLLKFSLLMAVDASLSKPVAPFDPYEVAAYIEEQAASAPPAEDGQPRILVIGDSWADVVGFGWGESFLGRVLKKHGCNNHVPACIAIPGTTTDIWSNGIVLAALKLVVKRYDYVFFTLVGNDALDKMPSCASADPTKSSVQCGDDLMAEVLPNMYKMVDGIHKGNPDARVVSFGYDTMFGGLGCGSVPKDMFPQCYNGQDVPKEQGNRCFNTQFLRIQEAIDWLDGNRTFFDSASILGATQVAGGDTKASTDPNDRHIDMDEMGPGKYWPVYEACFHPGVFGGDDSGAMIVMEEFYKVYWSKQLSCDSASIAV